MSSANNRKGMLLTWIVTLFLIFPACQEKETTKNSDQRGAPDGGMVEHVAKEKMGEPERVYTFPLTGKKTNKASQQRIVGVMINNTPEARPQSGLHKADLVYEVLAEGYTTRLLAFFQSEPPELIGPVRSARNYFVQLNNGYDAIYVHHGWSPSAKEMLMQGKTDFLNGLYYDGTLFKRVHFRKAPHNSYVPYTGIIEESKKRKYELNQQVPSLSFLAKGKRELQGDPSKFLSIAYGDHYRVSYRYQPDRNIYLRYTNGEQTVDRETGLPIELSNVLVIGAKHQVVDRAGRRNINLNSGGKALFFQQGQVKDIRWKNKDGRIIPVMKGVPVSFAPGKSWIHLVPRIKPDVNWH